MVSSVPGAQCDVAEITILMIFFFTSAIVINKTNI